MRDDYRGGHKALCGKPPHRIPGDEEERLCKDVSHVSKGQVTPFVSRDQLTSLVAPDDTGEEGDAGDDGSGSWESIESDEEEDSESEIDPITDIVYRFFNKLTYKSQRSEEDALLDGGAD